MPFVNDDDHDWMFEGEEFYRRPSLQEQAPEWIWVQVGGESVHMLNMCERHLRNTYKKFKGRKYLRLKLRQIQMVLRLIEEGVHIPPEETIISTRPQTKYNSDDLLTTLQIEYRRRERQAEIDRARARDRDRDLRELF